MLNRGTRTEDVRTVVRQNDETADAATPQRIVIVDDVLAAATYFRAMRLKLAEQFPGVSTVGIFIATARVSG